MKPIGGPAARKESAAGENPSQAALPKPLDNSIGNLQILPIPGRLFGQPK
jgi:hypothetical protein